VTHHHADHTAGLAELRAATGAPVFAPAGEAITPRDHAVAAGERVTLFDGALVLETIPVPGHTRGALAWRGPGFVCTGDTLFAAGCGRLFEGTPAEMHASLARLAALPGDLEVLCGHEYTLANLAFAAAVEPHNPALPAALARARERRAAGRPSLPTTLAEEAAVNPFLRIKEPEVRAAAERQSGKTLADEVAVFAALRAWKDGFIPPAVTGQQPPG
jgi:hydroxyacylglutathione hydrolase